MMKPFVISILFFGVILSAMGQGTLRFNNANGRGQILFHGVPVQPGDATVQLVSSDGHLIGEPAEIFLDGVFLGGTRVIPGATGTISLRLAVTYHVADDAVIYSESFLVALGGSGVPPKPPTYLPPFDDINFAPNLTTPDSGSINPNSSLIKQRSFQVDKDTASKFYRADELSILSISEDSIAFKFKGELEVADSVAGPWVVVE